MSWSDRTPRDVSDYSPERHHAKCKVCPLKGSRYVPFEGPSHGEKPRLVIVGEGPGYSEQVMRRPFVGRSGKFLDATLEKVDISRSEIHVTNSHMCVEAPTFVRMADGTSVRISELVRTKHAGPVLTIETDGRIGARPITGWYRNTRDGRRTIHITHEYARRNGNGGTSRSLVTEDHRVLTTEGWLPAIDVDGRMIATGDPAPCGAALCVAIGTLLGDGHVGSKTAVLRVTHAADQREWLELKSSLLGGRIYDMPAVHGWQPKAQFVSYRSAFFREMRAMFYRDGRKHIPASVAGALSDLTLATWYLDDGSCTVDTPSRQTRQPRAEIAAAGFARDELQEVVASLRAKGFDCKLSEKGPHRIHFSVEGTKTLSARIAQFVPPTMQYKLMREDRGKFDHRAYASATTGSFYAKAEAKTVEPPFGEAVFCIDVESTHNFITTSGVLHNCLPETDKDAERAAECCAPRLLRELKEIPADVPIMALGKAAARSVLGVRSILLARGFIWTTRDLAKPLKAVEQSIGKAERENERKRDRSLRKDLSDLFLRREILQGRQAIAGRTVLPTIHPAFVLRADVWTPIMNIDFKRAADWLDGRLGPKDLIDETRKYVVVEKLQDVRKALAGLGPVISCDIETGKDPMIVGSTGKNPITAKVLCVGMSDGKKTMVIGPWRKEVHARELTKAFSSRTVGFHNGYNFDHIALERDGVKLDLSKVEDTLLAHHAFASHFPQRLDHVVSVFLPACTPWKIKHGMRGGAEEKGLLPDDMTMEDLAGYNASDAIVQARTWNAIQDDLRPEMEVYQHDKQLAALCKEMYVTGIRRDVAHADALAKKMRNSTAGIKGEMRSLLHRPNFHPSRLDDVRKALKQLKVGALFVTPTGQVSTASATMEAIGKGDTRSAKFARHMLRWRGINKARSTYIEAPDIQPLADGRFHPNWKPFGTVTGRLASRAQSMPRLVLTEKAKALLKKNPKWKAKDVVAAIGRDATYEIESRVREIYIPAEGKVFVYFDIQQSEMRAAAYLSGDDNFIKSCESGDVHTANAKILFPESREVLERDPKGEGGSLRSITKNAGFRSGSYTRPPHKQFSPSFKVRALTSSLTKSRRCSHSSTSTTRAITHSAKSAFRSARRMATCAPPS
jgi:uracil-DNA glycosylase